MSHDKWIKLLERILLYGFIIAVLLWLLAAMASL
jgi:hypothetical protein